MTEPRPGCARCGQRAIVHTRYEDPLGPIFRHLCLRCADHEASAATVGEAGVNLAAVVLSVGLIVLFLSVFADVLAFGNSAGFGWQQKIGVLVGAVLLLLGAVMRIRSMAVVGLIAGALSLLADWTAFGSGPGFGAKQVAGVVLGSALLLLGFKLARPRNGGSAADRVSEAQEPHDPDAAPEVSRGPTA